MKYTPLSISRWLMWLILAIFPMSAIAELVWDSDGNPANGVNDGNGTWNTTNLNWWNGTTNVAWPDSPSEIAVFGSGGILTESTRIVTVSGTVIAGGLKFDPLDIANDSHAYHLEGGLIQLSDGAVIELVDRSTASFGHQRLILSSNISGNDVTIRKTGLTGSALGSVQLRNSKSWTGTLTLEDATDSPSESLFVELYHADAVNSLGMVSIGPNTTFTIFTSEVVTTDFTMNSQASRGALRVDVANAELSGNLDLTGDSRINFNNASNSVTLSGTTSGSGTLALGATGGTYLVTGNLQHTGGLVMHGGVVILAGANTMTGNVTFNGGELKIGHEGAMNAVTPQSIVFVNGSTAKKLTLDGYSVKVGGLTGNASSNITVQNGAASDATLILTAAGISFGGTITDGSGGGKLHLEYQGANSGARYALNGNNSYSGLTKVTSGTLIARGHANSLGSGSLVEVATNARLELDQGVVISGKHLVTPVLVAGGGNGTWNGTVQAQHGSSNLLFTATSPNTLTVNGEVNGTSEGGTLADVIFDGSGTLVMNGDIVSARRLVRRGSGTVVLAGSNRFNSETASGSDFGLSIEGGTVRLQNINALYEGNGAYNNVTFHSNTNNKTLQVYGVDAYARTLFSGNTAFDSVVENGSDTDATLILVNPENLAYGGVIRDGGAGKLGLKLTGGGIQTLNGANTYTGDTVVAEGSNLILNFGREIPEPAPLDNIINHDANESALILQGGILTVQGKAAAANTQRFNGLIIDGGYSTLAATAGASGGSVLVDLGDITYLSGSVNFILPAGTQSATNGVVTSSDNDATGILGTWATVNGQNLAMVDDSGNIVAYDGYTDVTNFSTGAGALGPIPNAANANVRIIDGGSSGNIQLTATGVSNPTTINSLVQSAVGDAVIHLNDWQNDFDEEDILRLGEQGLVMLAQGAGNLTIKADDPGDGGVLTAGGANQDTAGTLTFANYSSTSQIIVNADIIDNGAGVVRLIKDGPGALVLNSGANLYSGGTLINGGLIEIAFDRSLGKVPDSFQADHLVMNGGGLRTLVDLNLDQNRGITLLENGGKFDVVAGTFNVGQITGVGGFEKSGAGTLRLTSANDYEGLTLVRSGTLRIEHHQALGATTGLTRVNSSATLLLVDGLHIVGETLMIAGNGNNQGALRLEGGANSASSAQATWEGDIILSHNASTASRIGVQNYGTLTVNGIIQNGTSNILNISATGANATTGGQGEVGVVVLAANNVYTGHTEITRGTLKLGIDDALPQGTVLQISIASSVTELMAFDMNGHDQTIAGLRSTDAAGSNLLNASANARIINSSSEKSVLTINQSINTSYEGSIRGHIDLIKEGTGTLTLTSSRAATSGSTDYHGKTEIREGTLALSGVGDVAGTEWIHVHEGANFDVSARTGGGYRITNKTVSGNGTVIGNLTVDQNSLISPGGNMGGDSLVHAGQDLGRLTVTGNLTLDPIVGGDLTDARMLLQLSSSNSTLADLPSGGDLSYFGSAESDQLYDSINVQGTLEVSSGSSILLTMTSSHQLQWGQVFNLLDWGSDVPISTGGVGEFDVDSDLVMSAELSSFLDANSWFLDTTYFNTHGVVAIVPEPSRWLLLMTGLAGTLIWRTRRRPF